MDRLQDAECDIGGLQICGTRTKTGAALDADSGCIPDRSRTWSAIRAELITRKNADYDWRAGRIPIYVYHDNDELLAVAREAYDLYFTENALGRRAFPSLVGMEEELIGMCLALFQTPEGAGGSFTSGGTESIFLAVKTARDYFRATSSSHARPKIVLPWTAHPAFDKAAHYLDVEVARVPVGPDWRADVAALEKALDERTIMLVGSAPCYPYGVFDPIRALAELAVQRRLWLHVDACLGGFLAPFAREEGFAIPDFDFSIPGVTSLSADLHKFGFSARGASILLYRAASMKAHQGFQFDDWPRGKYSTETFLGSRPGGTIASAWAVMQYLGREGYRRLARKTMETKQRMVSGVDQIAGLKVVRPTDLNIVLYVSEDPRVEIGAVAEGLSEKRWFIGRTREPRAIHMALNPVHASVIDGYLNDLREVTRQIRRSGRVAHDDDVTY